MKPYSVGIEIDLPRERVLELFDDPDNLFKWQPGLQSFEPLSGEPGQPGARSKLVYLNGKRRCEMIEEVRVRELPEVFDGSYSWPGGTNTLENRFTEVSQGKTLWELRSAFHFKNPVMRLFSPLMRGMLRKESLKFMRHFKEFAEEGKDVREASEG